MATAGAKCSSAPAPPEATRGTSTTARTARSIARSKPPVVPSASMELSRISPAPSSAPRWAQATASIPVPVRPPCVVTSQPDGVLVPGAQVRASTLRTSTWLPNRSAISASSPGRATAAELTPTLSAPAARSRRTSSVERTPPPTVNGTNTCSAVARTTSSVVSRPAEVALTSRNVISSAPCAS